MININEVTETNQMIEKENFDVRTITMGISLLDCIDSDVQKTCAKIREKILGRAERLVKTGDEIAAEFGVPIVNKRISVTPVALIGGASAKRPSDPPLSPRACRRRTACSSSRFRRLWR